MNSMKKIELVEVIAERIMRSSNVRDPRYAKEIASRWVKGVA